MNLEEKKNLRIENLMRLIIELNTSNTIVDPLVRHVDAVSRVVEATAIDATLRATKADNAVI